MPNKNSIEIWFNPKRIIRLHRVCWSAYKRCWRGGRSPLVAKEQDDMRFSAYAYRDKDRNEFTQVTASCECGRGGWIRLPKHPHDYPPRKETK